MVTALLLCFADAFAQGWMPDEAVTHAATWLAWPHAATYGRAYRDRLEPTFVEMTAALVGGELVRVVVNSAAEQARVRGVLQAAGVPLGGVDMYVRRTDDVWIRDNGAIFVFDPAGRMVALDWGFNGWGFDAPFRSDDTLPVAMAAVRGVPRIDLRRTILEGGAFEVDGAGTFLATRSAILEPDRNPGLAEATLEARLTMALGVDHFIWLDGADGGRLDITDMHIDGFARFAPGGVLVTMADADLAYWGLSAADIATLGAAVDAAGVPFARLDLPLTANDVVTTYGAPVGFKGSYTNFYIANDVVLVPTYADPNDAVALALLAPLFPGRTVVGIDSRNLYRVGGMIHCVTQQEPFAP
jgi:agmatine deiminase